MSPLIVSCLGLKTGKEKEGEGEGKKAKEKRKRKKGKEKTKGNLCISFSKTLFYICIGFTCQGFGSMGVGGEGCCRGGFCKTPETSVGQSQCPLAPRCTQS